MDGTYTASTPASARTRRHRRVEERDPGQAHVQAQHRDLLLDLAAAAQDRRAGAPADARDDGPRLRLRGEPEGVVDERVVHARVHEVLPDQDAQLVAQVVERVLLVGTDARDPQHVHACVTDGEDGRPQLVDRRRESDDVQRRPQRPTDEDRHPVDVQGQSIPIDVVVLVRPGGDLAEADAAGVDDRPWLVRPVRSVDDEPDAVGRRVAVGVRPPPFDRGQSNDTVGSHPVVVLGDPQRLADRAGRPGDLDVDRARGCRSAGATQTGMDGQDTVITIEAWPKRQVVDDDPAPPLQPDGPPRTDGRRPGREARDPTQQHRAEPAQVVVRDQAGPPAGSRLPLDGQLGCERTTADDEFIRATQPRPDVHGVGREHRLACQQGLAVQEDLGQRGDPAEAQDDVLTGHCRFGLEADPEPPVLPVEVSRVASRLAQRAGRCARHARGQPLEAVQARRSRVGIGGGERSLPTSIDRDADVRVDARPGRGHGGAHDASVRRRRVTLSPRSTNLRRPAMASLGSNGRRRASLKPSNLHPSTIRAIAAEAVAPSSPSSQSTCDPRSSKPEPGHPEGGERVRVVQLVVPGEDGRQVRLQALVEPLERVARHDPVEVASEQRLAPPPEGPRRAAMGPHRTG